MIVLVITGLISFRFNFYWLAMKEVAIAIILMTLFNIAISNLCFAKTELYPNFLAFVCLDFAAVQLVFYYLVIARCSF